ncbi:hypothetical protein JHK86_001439 [Glycine max]|nr:hypothetical protein JHK86_001439 [Glycine max]
MKHIEVDCHLILEKVQQNLICTSNVKTGDQLANVLTKALNGVSSDFICNKLGIINIYAPT